MNQEAEKHIAAKVAKKMAILCLRNTHLENIHLGKSPVTRTGDWSDVTVVDADGNRIPWTDASHVSDDEMRDLKRDIVNRWGFQIDYPNNFYLSRASSERRGRLPCGGSAPGASASSAPRHSTRR